MFCRPLIASVSAVALVIGAVDACVFPMLALVAQATPAEYAMTDAFIQRNLGHAHVFADQAEHHDETRVAILSDRFATTAILLFIFFLFAASRLLKSRDAKSPIGSVFKQRFREFLDWFIFLPLLSSLRRGIIHSKIYA
jgi:hypothetical protein